MSADVVVVGGGRSREHEVSLASAAAVTEALEERGRRVDLLLIGADGIWADARGEKLGATSATSLARVLERIDGAGALFPAVHGAPGEDGALAALCALAAVPLVGSASLSGAVGMDKHLSKLVARDAGVRTAPGVVVDQAAPGPLPFATPVVVKPVAAGSSHGVTLVREEDALPAAIREALAADGSAHPRALAEPVILGREIDVAVLREPDGSRWAPPALEIEAEGLFDTETKYGGSARFTVPARLTSAHAQALEEAALTLFDAFGCDGLARLDFFLTEDGPVFNEINTMPGLTSHSQAPRMFAAAGVGYGDLVDRMVRGARIP